MTNYRRDHTPGATWFFTLNLADRQSSLLTNNIPLLRDAFRYSMGRHPWRIDAVVILPDHLHAICTLPPTDADYALRWRLIKTTFSRSLNEPNPSAPADCARASVVSGNDDSGNTASATTGVSSDTSITSTTTHASMGM